MSEIGFVGALLVRPLPRRSGEFQILDGHCRLSEFPEDAAVPCLVVDGLTDADAAKLIATYDPLGALAEIDDAVLAELTANVQWSSPDLARLVESVLLDCEVPTDPAGVESLPSDDAGPMKEMSFELDEEQARVVVKALKAAKKVGRSFSNPSENSNAAALVRLAETYLRGR